MKRFLESRIALGLICFIAGVSSVFIVRRVWLKHRPALRGSLFAHLPIKIARKISKNMDSFFERSIDDDFFNGSEDLFEEMDKMREQMIKRFDVSEVGDLLNHRHQRKLRDGSVGDIKKREDAQYIYYDIAVQGLKQEKVNVQVQDGQITISGQIENKTSQDGSESYSSSSFQRSFPVPDGVDVHQIQVGQEQDKLVVKFPKGSISENVTSPESVTSKSANSVR